MASEEDGAECKLGCFYPRANEAETPFPMPRWLCWTLRIRFTLTSCAFAFSEDTNSI